MKRILLILLTLCLLFALCACGAQTPEAPTTEPTEAPTTAPTEAPTTEATEPPTTEATEPPAPTYVNPLNGETTEEPYSGRPVAVVINNIAAAQPQYGISKADIVYELETEGDVTRLLAIFSDLSDVGSIGPVRSARTFFNSIALSFDAPLIHCGGSPAALSGHADDAGNRISNWNHINESYHSNFFFRDLHRYNELGYSWEHTLFTSGELLQQAIAEKGYVSHSDQFLLKQEGERSYGLCFGEPASITGGTANTLKVVFRYGKTTTMTYDSATGLYTAAQYGKDHYDAGEDTAVTYRNVLVLCTSQWNKNDTLYDRSYYQLLGEGSGYYACNGQIIPIRWQRDTHRDSFRYTLEDGTPLPMGAGATYVGITAASTPVKYE